MSARNVLVIMADEHAPDALGCAGHPLVKTPNLDRLASAGSRFTRAYTPSPICVPARAAFQTGQYVHNVRCWSNAQPYHGQVPGWGQRLQAEGHEVVSVGKLHYRSVEDDNGFSREIVPLHIRNGQGWVQGLLRRHRNLYDASGFAQDIGPGEDPYSDYDRTVAREAVAWLKSEGTAPRDKPWVLFVSFLRPHYPLTCPKDFYDLYPLDQVPPARFAGANVEYAHPVLSVLRSFCNYDDYFDERTRIVARASYFGLCSFMDDLVGDVLGALEESGRDKDTAVIYCSDHGELNGEHGLWTKMTMHEPSVGIPLLLSGAGAPKGVSDTQVSLIDIGNTVMEAAGVGLTAEESARPARSLYDTAVKADPDRVVLSEYHDGGSITGFFMVRVGRWKYVYYPGFAPQLFDMEADPHEQRDLGLSAQHADIRERCHAALTGICDPDAVNDLCFADQAALIDELGGPAGILNIENFDHTPVDGAVMD